METFRTSEERFEGIDAFPYAPRYREWHGMRLSHLDEGDRQAPPVVLLHGEPTWAYLWRKVVPPLLEAGYRCVAPDLPGFGRSDKPTNPNWYSYDRHTDAVVSLLEELDLREVTLVVHDWGGPIGFRAATLEVPERISRLIVTDTGVFDGHQRMSAEWLRFRDFVAHASNLPVKRLIKAGCKTPLDPAVLASYEAPFPTTESKAGAKAFPALIPLSPKDPGAEEGAAVKKALAADQRPVLLLWADADAVLPLETAGNGMESLLGTNLRTVENAGHFLQEDRGEFVGEAIVEWLKSSP